MQNREVIAVFSAIHGRGGGINLHSRGVKLIKQLKVVFFSSSGGRLRKYFLLRSSPIDRSERNMLLLSSSIRLLSILQKKNLIKSLNIRTLVMMLHFFMLTNVSFKKPDYYLILKVMKVQSNRKKEKNMYL